MSQGTFRLDLNRCTGCSACAIACRIENDLPMRTTWRRVHTFNVSRLPQPALFHYSLACNHCLDPACLEGCPARAYTKDPATGAVHLREELCIGCRYCSWVCPYEAPQFDSTAGTMSKCTFCHPRLEDQLEPACTTACPVEALEYVRDAELRTIDAPGFPEVGIRPAVLLTPKRRGYRAPEIVGGSSTSMAGPRQPQERISAWAGLRTEWSLLVFSLLSIFLVAWFTSVTVKGEPLSVVPFVAIGAFAMAVSALHLGKRIRVYRSILNLRRSWVSREIAFFLTFYGAATILGITGIDSHPVRWAVAFAGFGALASMDMVYRVRGQRVAAVPHSAMATLTALLVIGILLRDPVLVLTIALLKLFLYETRLLAGRPTNLLLPILRLGIGFVAPLLVWIRGGGLDGTLIPAALLIGEFIDRAQFYGELQFLNPARQIEDDLIRITGQEPGEGSPSHRACRDG